MHTVLASPSEPFYVLAHARNRSSGISAKTKQGSDQRKTPALLETEAEKNVNGASTAGAETLRADRSSLAQKQGRQEKYER
jgi:hypothetical protein